MTRTELRLGVALAACALLLVCFTVQQQPTALLEDFADYPSAFSKLVKNHHRGTAFGHGAPPRSGSSSSAWLPPSSSRYSAPEDVLYLKHSSAWYRRLAAEKTKIMQERQDQRDTAERNSKVGWERIAALKSKSASSMADEEYYQDKRHLAKSQLDFSRSRAQATESDVLAAKLAAFTAQQAAESAHEKEMMAVAAKNTAVQKEEEVDENARQFLFAEEAARVQAQTKQIENTSRPNVKYSNDYQRPEPTTPDVDQLHLM